MYKIDDIEFDFKRVTTEDALKVKSAMMILANEKASIDNTMEANKVIDNLAFKYLRIKDKKGVWLENASAQDMIIIVDSMFENQFAGVEIVAKFQERLQGFLQNLPSFQSLKRQ